MAVQQPKAVRVRADLELLVTRNARGDLTDGVLDRLAKVDGVETVEDVTISGLRPGLNDLAVEVTATLHVATPRPADDAALEALLTDGFGVERAAVARFDETR
jgi:hypothetical protein